MKGVSDDDIARWIFDDSEIEGEFSDKVSMKNVTSSSPLLSSRK